MGAADTPMATTEFEARAEHTTNACVEVWAGDRHGRVVKAEQSTAPW